MDSESVQRLMDVLLQMRINLQQIAKTFTEQTGEIRNELESIFHAEKQSLDQCVRGVENKLADCQRLLNDYRETHASLSAMHQKLLRLGGDAGAMPPQLPAERLEDLIQWRLQELRDQGKL